MNKAGGGKPYGYYDWKGQSREQLLKTRWHVLELMKAGIVKSSLRCPVIGPDFGGSEMEGKYLPALKRYSQGAFIEGLKASKTRLTEWGRENRLYFISGLYGIVHCKEPIQNYDLDLLQAKVQEEWKASRTLTEVLLSDLRWKRAKGDCVFDCCANETYQSLIDWESLRNEGLVVRHAARSGEFTGHQVRWACGHLSGAAPERLADMVEHEGSQYSSDNGSIQFLKKMQVAPSEPRSKESDHRFRMLDPFALVAVACLRPGQYDSFMNYARKKGWDEFIRFEPIQNLLKSTVEKFDRHGFKLLVAHVDQTHAEVRKVYKISGSDLAENLPKDWQFRKVTNESFSDIQFRWRLLFKA